MVNSQVIINCYNITGWIVAAVAVFCLYIMLKHGFNDTTRVVLAAIKKPHR